MKKLFGVFLLLILIIALGACGSSVPIANYENAISEKNSIQNELDLLSDARSLLQGEHNVLMGEKAALQRDYNMLLNEKTTLQSAYDAFRAEAAVFLTLNEDEQAATLEVARRESEIYGLESKIEELNAEVETLNSQITELQASIIRIAGESRAFPAGVLYAGTDFEIGRYRIYGGTSNFFVTRGGHNVVNIILGGGLGVTEYIFTFRNGDAIESRSSFRMVPIE